MKRRMGFVSNSSSSSFFMFGVMLERSDLKEILKDTEDLSDLDFYEMEEVLSSKITEASVDLNIKTSEDYDILYIGAGITKMKEEETLRQFRDRIKSDLVKIDPGFENKAVEYHSECSYNG